MGRREVGREAVGWPQGAPLPAAPHARPARPARPILVPTMSDEEVCPKPALEEACKKHCVKYLVAYEVR